MYICIHICGEKCQGVNVYLVSEENAYMINNVMYGK